MRLEHYSEEKLKKEILEIAGKYVDLEQCKVFFFGSRVAGKGDERSDIDIGIEGLTPLPPGVLLDIQDDIENLPTLYKIDVVDFSQLDERFKQVAKEHIEIIH